MDTKNFKFQYSKEVDEEGRFTGHASVFGNIDLAREIVDPGAFTRTLQHHNNWTKILWQHWWDSPIGGAKVLEDETGLQFEGQLVMDGVPEARRAYSLMKTPVFGRPVIDTMSIGYDVVQSNTDENGIRHLTELKLYEISPVTFAANPMARIDSVKGLGDLMVELKAGRVLSASNRKLVLNAVEALQALLEASGSDDDSGKSHSSPPPEEPELSTEKKGDPVVDHSLDKELQALLDEIRTYKR